MLPSLQADPRVLAIGEQLARLGQRLMVIEAGAGGHLQARLNLCSGASRWYLGGVVCYHDSIKTGLLGLDPEVLRQHGAVSPQSVAALARCGLERSTADWVLAESGVYGPGGGSPEKPVGLVYLHVVHADGESWSRRLDLTGSRLELREQVADQALDLLQTALQSRDALGATANLE